MNTPVLFDSESVFGCGGAGLERAVRQRLQIRIDERIQIAVHDGLDITGLAARADILDKRILHEYIGTDLAAPLNLELIALDI